MLMSSKINSRENNWLCVLLELTSSKIHNLCLYDCNMAFGLDKKHSCVHRKFFFFFSNSQLFKFLFLLSTPPLSVLPHLSSTFFCSSFLFLAIFYLDWRIYCQYAYSEWKSKPPKALEACFFLWRNSAAQAVAAPLLSVIPHTSRYTNN
jgi:hypothetical protein